MPIWRRESDLLSETVYLGATVLGAAGRIRPLHRPRQQYMTAPGGEHAGSRFGGQPPARHISEASIPELNQIASRHRHILRQGGGAAGGEMENAVELAEGVLRRGAIDRHHHLVTAPGRAVAGGGDRPLGGGAG